MQEEGRKGRSNLATSHRAAIKTQCKVGKIAVAWEQTLKIENAFERKKIAFLSKCSKRFSEVGEAKRKIKLEIKRDRAQIKTAALLKEWE